MYMDRENQFSDAQTVTADAFSTDKIDLGKAGRDLGVGEQLFVQVSVQTAMTDASSNSTITVELHTSADPTFATSTKVQTIGILAALSAVGAKLIGAVSSGLTLDRYLAIKYVTTNGDLTTGKFDAFLLRNPDQTKAYADNSKITL